MCLCVCYVCVCARECALLHLRPNPRQLQGCPGGRDYTPLYIKVTSSAVPAAHTSPSVVYGRGAGGLGGSPPHHHGDGHGDADRGPHVLRGRAEDASRVAMADEELFGTIVFSQHRFSRTRTLLRATGSLECLDGALQYGSRHEV